MARRTAFINERRCVACGTCAKACPLGAISVVRGLYARVDQEKCVGCGKCAALCPADIITFETREAGA